MERWKNIDGYPTHDVSNMGNIRHAGTTKVRKKQISIWGYEMVMLYDAKGKRHNLTVHRLVAKAFIPNPENKREVNHKNKIRTDNRLCNLEWCTPSENMIHAMAHRAKPKLKPIQKRKEEYFSFTSNQLI